MDEKKKVLIVDDEEDLRTLLKERLVHAEYEVISAENGEEAIKVAKQQRPDLIMLDIMMPGLDGIETAKILEHTPETQDIPIIFLTCLVKKEEAGGGKNIAGHYFIAKPYDAGKLLEAIETHIKK